jgi:Tol biopolymer transport system component/predicted Ser/Thr protein kinase
MTLAVGTKLGPYEILAPLGAGGMGEVYRARDSRLGREIAIKVLPAELSGDAERRARFEQEARSASGLNHPNIVTLYDIGTQDGALYIAMELVEGRTLRELLVGTPLPARKLLDVAVQLAEGLAKAHNAGIVHRDLKPENVVVSKDSFVKILDFGLAKLVDTPAGDVSHMPTIAEPGTRPGTVLGTVGYMSPEQASGQAVDFRSDQFSLGSIVYEMVTGKRPFQKPTPVETMSAIIREEPDPVARANPAAPPPLRWIVERCLAKEPDERYASTRDLARDLASVRDHLSETSASAGVPAAIASRPRRRGWLLPAAAGLLLGAALALAIRAGLQGRPDSKLRMQILTFRRGTVSSARFAPDGQTVVYAAAWDGQPLEVFTARTDGLESRALGIHPADVLSVSSTGELALSLNRHYFTGFQSTGTLARAPLGGGAPREILENVQDADWSPDGKELAVARYTGSRCLLEYPIGRVLYQPVAWVSDVRVSPDGRKVAFIDHPQLGDNVGTVRVVDEKGTIVLSGPTATAGLAWSPRGDEVWSSAPLTATSLSGKRRAPWNLLGPLEEMFDISSRGGVLFKRNSPRREIIGSFDGGPERNLTWLNWSFPVDISRDGKLVLFDEQTATPNGMYIRKLDGSPAVLLAEGKSFQLSPDGRWALAAKEYGGDTLLLLPTGAGEARKIPLGRVRCQWAKFFPDARRILIAGSEPGAGIRIYTLDLEGGTPRAITPEGVSILQQDPFSPDGRSFAAAGPDRRFAIYSVAGGEPRPISGLEADDFVIRWSADGRSVYVSNTAARPGKVDLVDVRSGTRSTWREFHAPDPAGVLGIAPFIISPDGRSYVYSYRRLLDELYVVNGLR